MLDAVILSGIVLILLADAISGPLDVDMHGTAAASGARG